jgi:serine/threonine-protein kinase
MPSPVGEVLRPGAVIASRYEIKATLGMGGMGVVYRARDRVLDETVALKVLRPEFGLDAHSGLRLRSEIKLAWKVRHKNVCGIHEYGEDGPWRYISMELVEGSDLKRLLAQRGPLPWGEGFEIAIQVAEGLQAIHDAGVIHRDLKTPNITRDAQGLVRLMDFGIAKQEGTSGLTATGEVVGSPEYMSPEQVRGQPLDLRSDIYAVGIVLFEMFTGRTPFRAETAVATMIKHIEEPPPLEGPDAQRIPPALVPILRRALAKAPAERFASAGEMLVELRRAQAMTEPQATGPTRLVPRLMPGAADRSVPPSRVLPRVTAPPTVAEHEPFSFAQPPSRSAAWRGPATAATAALVIAAAPLLWSRRPSPVVTTAPPPPLAARDTRELDELRLKLAQSEEARARAEARPEPAPSAPVRPPAKRAAVLPPPRPVPPAPALRAAADEEAALQRLAAAAAEPLPPPSPLPLPVPPSAVASIATPEFVPPLLEQKSPPEYPPLAMRQGVQGVVELKVLVDEAGRVADARWISGPPALSEAALASVRSRLYRPARRGGRPVRAWVTERIRFELR